MNEHAEEYRQAFGLVHDCEESTLLAHWRMGKLFTAYDDSSRTIADIIGKSQAYIIKHMIVAQKIPTEAEFTSLCDEKGITGFHEVYALISGSKADRRSSHAGGIQIQVPAHVIKGIADLGANPRDVMENFWANVTPRLLVEVAYPGAVR